jgi:hypothetical protein
MARGRRNTPHRFGGAWLLINALNDLFDPTADRAILLRPKHCDLACPHFRRQGGWAIFLEALDAFLDALQAVE